MEHLLSHSIDCQGNHIENRACIQNKELQLTGGKLVIAISLSPDSVLCDSQQPVAALKTICSTFWVF